MGLFIFEDVEDVEDVECDVIPWVFFVSQSLLFVYIVLFLGVDEYKRG